MIVTTSEICDLNRFSNDEARELARLQAVQLPMFDLDIAKLLREECASNRPNSKVVARLLAAIDGACEGNGRLLALLRPMLSDSDPMVRSKCVMMFAGRKDNFTWAKSFLTDSDERIRANVVEALWGGNSVEMEEFFQQAATDKYHRVAANAIYGLLLIDKLKYKDLLNLLVNHESAAFRGSATWLLRKVGDSDLLPYLRPMLRDTDANVKRAAFRTLAALQTGGER